MGELWDTSYKVNSFILEHIRINEFCPIDHYHTLNHNVFFTNDARVYGIWEALFPTNYTQGKAVKGLSWFIIPTVLKRIHGASK